MNNKRKSQKSAVGGQRKNEPFINQRRSTRGLRLGLVEIGGNAPISVQTMTKTPTHNASVTIRQILELEQAGCDIIRLAVPDMEAARAIPQIRQAIHIPLVADIHFDYRLAIAAIAGGADGLRLNPGNIGSKLKIKEVVKAAAEKNLPIRIGVNSGSLEKDILAKHGAATVKALVESALRHARILENLGHHAIKISVKASDVARTVEAYRLLSKMTDYPLHVGLTEAGTLLNGAVRSSVALGILLAEGIGDTIRVSLSDTPSNEVRVGLEILRSLGLHAGGIKVVACPTCGRAQMDAVGIARTVEAKLEKMRIKNTRIKKWPTIAVMGCIVNGPGEAREADIALVCGKNKIFLYLAGVKTVALDVKSAPKAVVEEVRKHIIKNKV